MNSFLGNIFGNARVPGAPIETLTGFVETFSYCTGTTEDGGLFSTTADKGVWLVTRTTNDAGFNPRVKDDADGGHMEMGTDDDVGDHCTVQVNGEMFYLLKGRPAIFQARMKIKTTTAGWFVGFAISDTDFLASAPSDYIGLGSSAGTAVLAYGAGVDSSDTSTVTLTSSSVSITADTFFTCGFEYDGDNLIRFFHYNESTGVLTTLGEITAANAPVGSKAEYMSPLLNLEALSAVEEVMTVDTLVCLQKGV